MTKITAGKGRNIQLISKHGKINRPAKGNVYGDVMPDSAT